MYYCPKCRANLPIPRDCFVDADIECDCPKCGYTSVCFADSCSRRIIRTIIVLLPAFALTGSALGGTVVDLVNVPEDVKKSGPLVGFAIYAAVGFTAAFFFGLLPAGARGRFGSSWPFVSSAEWISAAAAVLLGLFASNWVGNSLIRASDPAATSQDRVILWATLYGTVFLLTPAVLVFFFKIRFRGVLVASNSAASVEAPTRKPPERVEAGEQIGRERLLPEEEVAREAAYQRGTTEYDRAFAAVYRAHKKRRDTGPPAVLKPYADALLTIMISIVVLDFTNAVADADLLIVGTAVGATLVRTYDLVRYWRPPISRWGIGTTVHVPKMIATMFRTKSFYPYWWYRGWWMALFATAMVIIPLFWMPSALPVRVLLAVCWFFILLTMYLRPAVTPAVLILTGTSDRRVNWVTGIAYRLHPFRVVSLLDPEILKPSSRIPFDQSRVRYHAAKFHFLMRTHGSKWIDDVMALVDVAPFVLVDTRTPIPPAVVDEIRAMLLFESRQKKAVFVGTSEGDFPGLKQLNPAPDTKLVLVVEDDVEPLLWTLLYARGAISATPGYPFVARRIAEFV